MDMTSSVAFDGANGGSYPDGLYNSAVSAELLAGLDNIGSAELERYRAEGYLAVRSAVEEPQRHAVLAGIESLLIDNRGADIDFEAWAQDRLGELNGTQRLDVVRKFMWFADKEPRVRAVAYDERLLQVVRRLVGSHDLALFQDMALLKPPGGGREKPWHQDNAYFNLTPGTPIVALWLALDDATPENGCMHVIPGSHRQGPVVHFRRRDWQICDTDVQTAREVAVPLPAGGALFFDGLLHHGTPTNRSTQRRRAIQFHYVPADAVRTGDDDRLAIFGSEGKDVTC